MNDSKKTKQQLIDELSQIRAQINEVKKQEIAHGEKEQFWKESAEQYKSLIENSPLGIISVEKSGKINIVNKSLLQILGSPSEEATLSINILKYVPMIEAGIAEAVLQCFETGRYMITEHPYRTKWRKNVFFRLHLGPTKNETGEVIGCEAIVEDISERKSNEEELRINEECFRAIADYTYNWESWFGTDGSLLWVNPAVERITGYTVEECESMGNYPEPIIHKNDLHILKKIIDDGWSERSEKEIVIRIKHKNRSIIWISMAWQKVYSSENEPLGVRTSFHDITAWQKGEN